MNEYAHEFEYLHVLGFSREITNRIYIERNAEKAMAPHSSTLASKIPWTEEPGKLQSMGLLRVGHDFIFTFTFTFHFHACIGEGNGNPLQCSCLENPRDGGASWAAIYGIAQSWTRLKPLSAPTHMDLN